MVHLRSVCLRGFKSFAKPTELTFEPGVTVIIGPNGSGKSNIADAVLWVLGEQSPGNLRGRSMQDVIFSGPGGRKSSAVAEVSLVFENGSGASLPFEYEQLEVTRRLERDSGSEYRMNGSGCRLLDVQDLFGGLGLGREMHSVISQGKVDSLLNSTSEARRALVEEAAGLGRFKKRRERAQIKLERTKQNLLRVGDIEREVKAALRPLRQQVAAAEKFAEAAEEWASAKAKLLLLTLLETRESAATAQREVNSAEARLQQLGNSLAELHRERAAEEERFAAALAERETLSSVFHRVRAEAEQMEGRAATLRQRLARTEGELDRARRRFLLATGEADAAVARLTQVTAATADEARLRRVSAWSDALRQKLEASLPEYRAAVAAEDELKDAVFELEAARSRVLQNRDLLRREIDERSRVGAELAGVAEQAAARVSQLEEETIGLREKAEQARLAVEQAEAVLRIAAEERERARDAADQAAQAEAGLVERLAGLEARRAVLSDIVARREGAPAGVRQLLGSGQGWRSLTEVLTVAPGYERAFAAALGTLVQAAVAPEALDLLAGLAAGGPLEAIAGQADDDGASGAVFLSGQALPAGTVDLWDVVTGPAGLVRTLRELLPPTALVTGSDVGSLAEALGGLQRGQATERGWRLVTLNGELVDGEVHVARRQEVAAETVLRSRNELQAVEREHRGLKAEREAAASAIAEAAASLTRSETLFREREQKLREAQRNLTAQTGDCDLQVRRLEQARAQHVEVQGRRERESGLAERFRAELESTEQSIKAREAELERARTDFRALQAKLAGMRARVDQLEDKKSQAALVEVRLRERCRSQESDRSRVLVQRDAAEREKARCRQRVTVLEAYLPVVGRLLHVGESLAERARTVVTALEQSVEATRAQTDLAAGVMRDRSGAEAGLQTDLQQTSAGLTDIRVTLALLRDRENALDEGMTELRRRHLSPRGLSPADVAGEDEVTLTAAVERAERRRERIGPVNPLAEQECAEMEERARFLAEQRGDLESSLRQLQDVIRDLDEHIDTTFSEIYGAAREHFSAVIASVFPGAKGTLKLTEPKSARGAAAGERAGDAAPAAGGFDAELLATGEEAGAQTGGIDIEVKFANKSPRSLSLLSGGEKAMTAIAFLFSLFLARPCPFYILDEVEASLDDINIRRFLTLVRKYREKTQFIIITHQRQTMEVADTLYGVTLESDGTSRVLSRRLATVKGE